MNRTASRTAPTAESTIAAVAVEPERSPAGPSLVTLPRDVSLDDQLAGASGTVLLDFYADWCGPCRMQSRILREMESEVAGSGAMIIKINVEEHPEIAERFAVSSLPTLLVVNDGEVRNRKTGLTDKDQLLAWIE
jgi:thioredoxin 1